MLEITLEQAEIIEAGNPNMYWDGWTLVVVKPNPMGVFKTNGILHNGKWHVAKRYDVDDRGMYHVPKVLRHGL